MTTGKTTSEELMKLATDFVTTQKGLWDHAAWVAFMDKVQAKGFDLSGEMQTNLGNMLEAMKRFYAAAAKTESMGNAMQAVVDDSVAFVKRHQGGWGHADWEDFVRTVEQNTLSLTESTAAYLGGVLESIKALYALSPAGMVQKHLSATREETPPASAESTKPAAAKASPEPKPAAKAPPEPKPAAKTPPEPKAAAKASPEPRAAAKAPPEPKPAAKVAPKPAAKKVGARTPGKT